MTEILINFTMQKNLGLRCYLLASENIVVNVNEDFTSLVAKDVFIIVDLLSEVALNRNIPVISGLVDNLSGTCNLRLSATCELNL